MSDSLELSLNKIFNIKSFRIGQREIIESVLGRRDVLAVMPTGGGKSLCYQLPAYMQPGLTIVISPLIALMNDQVKNLKALNLPAGCIHSGMDDSEKKLVFAEMKQNQSYILYLSPERVQKPGFMSWVQTQKLNLIAIDEAHCVSQWGHDFRPEYSQLHMLRECRKDVPMIGLTATATPLVKIDIIENLALKNPDQHVYGFYRPNLYYQVEFCEDENVKENILLQALKQFPYGRVLVYCGTRKKTKEWAQIMTNHNESAAFYHAGLSAEKRVQIEKRYELGKIRVLAATNAFGMGIDHPDVRLVIHTQMPGNIESYYQEIGRAGRDGEASTCLLAYSRKDKGLHSFFIRESEASAKIKSHRWQSLDAIVNYAESSECRHAEILTYFRDKKRITKCGHCDACAPDVDRRVQKIATAVVLTERKRKKLKKKLIEISAETEFSQEEQLKLELIREWRRNYAKERDMPAFMIFSDKTLYDLISKSPNTTVELNGVYGFGDKKISLFGEELIGVLKASQQ